MIAPREDLAPVVRVTNGQPTKTYLILDEKFGKRHDNVLSAIENLECTDEFTQLNFGLSEYKDSTGRVAKKTPSLPEGKPSAAAKPVRFNPTDLSPRHLRIVHALQTRSRTREQIDRIAGASNGPDEVMRLREKLGIEIPCVRIPAFDRDGHGVQIGVYSLTTSDRRKISAGLSKRQAGAIDAALAGLIAFGAVCAVLVLGVI